MNNKIGRNNLSRIILLKRGCGQMVLMHIALKKLMSRNTSVVIGKQHDKFIQAQIRKGWFGSASEAIRAGLSLFEEQELKIERLCQAIIAGETSGPARPFNMKAFIKSKADSL
jgi:antitoxin ParD1/3/4